MTTRRFVACGLACSSLLMMTPLFAQSPQQQAQGALELLEQATSAKGAGDYAAALAAYTKAAATMAKDPVQQDGWGLLLQADLQRDIARVTASAGAADPCLALDRGDVYLDRARRVISPENDVGIAEAVDSIGQQLKYERRRLGCARSGATAEAGKPDEAVTGHYYLSGVMETGSELRLTADGRFDWYISYGAVDQMAKGRWSRTGQTVTLVADLVSADAPLFRADQSFPWDEAIERRLRAAERSRQAEAIAELCPWTIGVAETPPLILADDRPTPGLAEQARAADAQRAAQAARDEASRAIAKAVAGQASDADRTAADAAMSAWYSARYEMEQAQRLAGLPEHDIGAPAMPQECQLPPTDADAPIPSSQWRHGVAVVVGDPAREMRLSRVGVTFVFSDGHREATHTSQGGWAFAPQRHGAAVEQLVLVMPESVSRSATLQIPPLTDGVQTVIVDTQQLVPPPFKVLRLEVQGRDLVPDGMGRGRYSRD